MSSWSPARGSASTSSSTGSASSSRPAGSSSSARASALASSGLHAHLLTREYPPDVYGGAGVHVEYLARGLAQLLDVTVHCWGEPRPADARPRVVAHRAWDELGGDAPHLA